MKKIEIDIPLEAYTDNVRRIIERSLHDLEAEPPYLTSFLCDPKLTEEDLETALHILEKAGTELTKQKFIRAELEARKEVVNPEVFPEDLRKDWEDITTQTNVCRLQLHQIRRKSQTRPILHGSILALVGFRKSFRLATLVILT